jgi:DNA-binding response OmpR family regulator
VKVFLVAGHDDASRQHLTLALDALRGWVVTAVPTGAKLLELVAAIRPDLVLLDVQFPGVDGIKVYRQFRERKGMGEVPVLFVTGTHRWVERAGLVGNVTILARPFRIEALIACVAELLGEPKLATRYRSRRY